MDCLSFGKLPEVVGLAVLRYRDSAAMFWRRNELGFFRGVFWMVYGGGLRKLVACLAQRNQPTSDT
jgi:hypothetical protein